MNDKVKLELIVQLIEKAYEYPAGDTASWAGFLEGTLNSVLQVAAFGITNHAEMEGECA